MKQNKIRQNLVEKIKYLNERHGGGLPNKDDEKGERRKEGREPGIPNLRTDMYMK